MTFKYNINSKFKREWQKKIIDWYKVNKRDLPWRKRRNQNFYKIWISEVMLQQTIVKTVIPYYEKFIERWPNLKSFFDASLDEILLYWQGLGYYQRAKNLFKAKEYLKKNKLYINSTNLKKVPGIGDYISSAISAILKNENCAVVDGNIKRILRRVFNLNENEKLFNKKILFIAKELTPVSQNGFYCQSLMDFANLVCKAKKPLCGNCILQKMCNFDLKKEKTNKQNLKIKKIGVGFFVNKNKNFLIEMSKKKLLQGLYSIPLSDFVIKEKKIESQIINQIISDWMSSNNLKTRFKVLGYVNHIFSHFHLKLFIVDIKLKEKISFNELEWVTEKTFDTKPKSTLMKKVKKKMLCKS